jgi:hypothetical protein
MIRVEGRYFRRRRRLLHDLTMSANLKLRGLSDKTIVLVVLSVYVVYILGLLKFLEPAYLVRKQRLVEIVVTVHLLCFFGFFIFFPKRATIIKGIVLCAIIPLMCCMIMYTSYYVTYIVDWKLPRSGDLFYFVGMLGLAPYFTLGAWVVSLPLLVVFGVCACLFRWYAHSPAVIPIQERIETNRFGRMKFILFIGVIYAVFAIAYDFVLKVKWGGYHEQIIGHGVPIYIFSFFSIIYMIPFIANDIRKAVLYCLVIPVFWPVFIGLIYTMLILVYASEVSHAQLSYYPGVPFSYSGMPFFRAEFLTFRFFLVRYFDIQAWFISFPLMAVWSAYYWRTRVKFPNEVKQ